MNARLRLGLGAAAIALLLALPFVHTGMRAAHAQQEPARIGLSELEIDAWRQRLAEANAALIRLRAELTEAEQAKRRMRSKNHPRGEAAASIEKRLEQARTQLSEAEAQLPALVEQARRAGVPPGVLRAYWN